MTSVIDLLVDGTSIQSYASILQVDGSLFATAPRRGSNFTIPGAAGVVQTNKPPAAFSFSVGLVVLPDDPDTDLEPAAWRDKVAQWVENWRAICALIAPATLTVTRVLPTVGGGTLSEECDAEVVSSIAPTMVGPYASRAVIDFVNLNGAWSTVAGGS